MTPPLVGATKLPEELLTVLYDGCKKLQKAWPLLRHGKLPINQLK
jgi:hypothetical protein